MKIVSAIVLSIVFAESVGAADFISVEGPVPEVNRGGCSTAVFVRPVTNRAAVVSAKWTVTGLGVFRVFLNGAEVGAEDFLKPGAGGATRSSAAQGKSPRSRAY